MKRFILTFVVALVAAQIGSADIVTVDQEIMIAGNGVVVPFGSAGSANSGAPSNGNAFRYAARDRSNAGQTDRMVTTFLSFDVSTLTAADVADPTFQAVFTIDYVGHLNTVNTGMDTVLSQVTGGSWDGSGANNPMFGWGEGGNDLHTVVRNAQLWANPIADVDTTLSDTNGNTQGPTTTFDITALVQGWFNGTITNNGLALWAGLESSNAGSGNPTNGSYFNNARIITSVETVPEPGSAMLVCLALSGIGLCRRKRS